MHRVNALKMIEIVKSKELMLHILDMTESHCPFTPRILFGAEFSFNDTESQLFAFSSLGIFANTQPKSKKKFRFHVRAL